MKAVILQGFGGPEQLVEGEMPRPDPGPDQMLVRVAACGVCGHDLLNRAGAFPHTTLPAVMGHEIAGTVVACGPLVSGFAPGDRVALVQRLSCGLCAACRAGRENLCVSGPGFYGEGASGGYGEYVIASARNAVHLPESIPLDVGSVLSCAIGTGLHALRRGRARIGETVVITGASGGVGLHAVMLSRLMGLRVIAISSSPDKAVRLREAGADEVVMSEGGRFQAEVRALTQGEGADLVLEIAGKPTFASSVRALRAGGRMVVIGNVDPGPVPLNPALAILKELEFIGSAHATRDDLLTVVDLVARGLIRPEIAAFLPVAEAAKAHAMIEARNVLGRVVLRHDHDHA